MAADDPITTTFANEPKFRLLRTFGDSGEPKQNGHQRGEAGTLETPCEPLEKGAIFSRSASVSGPLGERERPGDRLLDPAGCGQHAVGCFGDRLAKGVAVVDQRVNIPVEELHLVWIEARAGEQTSPKFP